MTSLSDSAKVSTDPSKYVSSTSFPYIVFPGNFNAKSGTGKIGDLGFAINLANNKKSHFVVAETGPAAADLGEMSIAFATAMGGVNPNPINGAGAPSGTILYVSFPFSSNTYVWPMTNTQMQINANTLLQNVGGEAGILACQGLL
jgi:Fungal chitosanase of glycosyl hydrolase group 75